MEREPFTYPFTEDEMQEIEAKAALEKDKRATENAVQSVGWASVPIWNFFLLIIFQEPLTETPAYMAVLMMLFPSILLGGLTGKLLAKPIQKADR